MEIEKNKLNKKIIISEIIILCFIVGNYLYLNYYLQGINYEISYRSYLKEINQNKFFFNETEIIKDTEEFKMGYLIIISMSINLILILNHLFYLNKKYFIKNK